MQKISGNRSPSARHLLGASDDSSILGGRHPGRGWLERRIFKKQVYYFLLFALAAGILLVLSFLSGA